VGESYEQISPTLTASTLVFSPVGITYAANNTSPQKSKTTIKNVKKQDKKNNKKKTKDLTPETSSTESVVARGFVNKKALTAAIAVPVKPAYSTKARKLDPEVQRKADNLYVEGMRLASRGNLDAAIAKFKGAIAIDPNTPAFHNELGVSYHARGLAGDAELAQQEYKAVLTLNPKNASAWHNLAASLNASGDHKSAEEAYRKALALDPKSWSGHQNLGVTLYAQHKFDDARIELNQALQLKPPAARKGEISKYLQEIDRSIAALSVKQAGDDPNIEVPRPKADLPSQEGSDFGDPFRARNQEASGEPNPELMPEPEYVR
jgi:Flp pilus assembly protein TadD